MCFYSYIIYYVLLAAQRPTFGHYWGHSLTRPILITAFMSSYPKSHWEPPNEIGFLNPAKRLVEFEPGIFWFNHNALILLACTFSMHDTSISSSYLNIIYWNGWSKSRYLVQLISSWCLPGSKKETLFAWALSVILNGGET